MALQGSPSVSHGAMLEHPAGEPARSRAPAMPRHKLLSLCEIVVVYGIIEAALWTEGLSRWQWSAVALAVVLVIGLYRRDLWPRLGLGRRGLAESLWVIPAAAALCGAFLYDAHLARTLHLPFTRYSWHIAVASYLLWAVQQQYLLQSFFLTRLESLLGHDWRAVLAAALLFAFTHLPNPVLVAATFALGLVFCPLFRVYRNLYALSVAHAMLGLALAAAIPEAVTRHMRVGIGYLHYLAR